MDQYIGKMLDNRYEILERIGTGGMAVVYKAKCHRLNRLVAVKILKSEYAQDEDFRRRFNAESQAVAQLSHANIMSIYDVSRNGDIEYIVMELLDGMNDAARKTGCTLPAPFMTLSFISLPTVPDLGITDLGLVDVLQHKLIPLLAE